jgi:hypothetical protein
MIGDVLIRRLKSEINGQDKEAGRPPRFATRYLEPLPLYSAQGREGTWPRRCEPSALP